MRFSHAEHIPTLRPPRLQLSDRPAVFTLPRYQRAPQLVVTTARTSAAAVGALPACTHPPSVLWCYGRVVRSLGKRVQGSSGIHMTSGTTVMIGGDSWQHGENYTATIDIVI